MLFLVLAAALVLAAKYRVLFALFFCAHKIAQALMCTLMRDPHTPLDEFIVELQLTDALVMNNVYSRLPDKHDVQDAVCCWLDQVLRTLSNTPCGTTKDSDYLGDA